MSTCTHESMTNHHGSGLFSQLNETFHTGASGCVAGANWRSGPIVTCTISACPGATSFVRPKSRFGGLERSQAGAAS